MDNADTKAPETDSLELAEKEVDKITHDFEDSISSDEKQKDKASPELDVLDLDLDLSNDNSSWHQSSFPLNIGLTNYCGFLFYAEIAQTVEQGTENPRVRSSILRLGTRKKKGLVKVKFD